MIPVAHKGFVDSIHPENSLSAISAAIQKGFNHIEIDIRKTRDCGFVVCHDANLQRLFESHIKEEIQEIDLEQLSFVKYKANGEHLLLFNKLLDCVKQKWKTIRFFIEIKDELDDECQSKLVEAIDERQLKSNVIFYPYKAFFGRELLSLPIGADMRQKKIICDKNLQVVCIAMPNEWTMAESARCHEAGRQCLTTIKATYFAKLGKYNITEVEICDLLGQMQGLGIDYVIVDSAYYRYIKGFLKASSFL